MAATEIVAVLDAGPLIHLDELGHLGLLNDFRTLLLPRTVQEEALRHRPGLSWAELSNLEIISEAKQMPENLQKLADEMALHTGEREALAVLSERGGQYLLSDDAAARIVASAAGFQTHGSIGLILRAHRRGNISKPKMLELLHALPGRTTLHLRKGFLDSIIARATTENT